VRRLRQQQGNILVEGVVAAAILVVALIPIFGSFMLAPQVHRQTGSRTVALNIARARLERLHALTGAEWDALPPSETAPDPSDPAYTVTQTVTPRAGLAGLKDVQVTVTWTDQRGRPQRLTLTTAVARRP
jgi:Tfp pilus assembly protein PilV